MIADAASAGNFLVRRPVLNNGLESSLKPPVRCSPLKTELGGRPFVQLSRDLSAGSQQSGYPGLGKRPLNRLAHMICAAHSQRGYPG
jgi:hypothetical protein